MKRFICLILTFVLFTAAGCADRTDAAASAPSSSSEASSSSEPESSSAPKPASSKASEPEESEPEAPPMPVLTEAELELLGEGLEVFIPLVGTTNLPDATAIDPAAALSAVFAEIDRTRDLAGYYFTKNDQKQELIPAELVAETAERMFGIKSFSLPDQMVTESGSNFYVYTAPAAQKNEHLVEAAGAPDDAIAYTVTFNETGSSYCFTCKVVRINSIPYLRLLSIERAG